MSKSSAYEPLNGSLMHSGNLRFLGGKREGDYTSGDRSGSGPSITAEPHESAEALALRRLWLSVIIQTFRDALLVEANAYDKKRKWCSIASTSPSNIPLVRARARTWLLETTKDFADVCGFAGLEPDNVRDAAKRVLGSATNIRAARRIFFSASPEDGAVMRYLRAGSAGELFDSGKLQSGQPSVAVPSVLGERRRWVRGMDAPNSRNRRGLK